MRAGEAPTAPVVVAVPARLGLWPREPRLRAFLPRRRSAPEAMLRHLAAVLIASLPVLSGCWTPPERRDPFAALSPATSPYRDLTVAVVLSENTKRSLEYTHRTVSSKGIAPRFDPTPVFEKITGVFTKDFKKAIRVERVSDLKKSGADVAVVLDIYVNLTMSDVIIDADAVVSGMDGAPLETLKGHGEQSMFAHFTLTIQKTVDEATDQAAASLQSSLVRSERLQALAKTGGAAPVAAAAQSAGPAADVRSDVDSPSYKSPERPDDFAVVIGISKYRDIPEAPFADNDAKAVKRHLLALGYPEENIITLIGDHATKSSLEEKLERWLPMNVTDKSTVFVYYSGHGAPDPESKEGFLVPWDGEPQALKDTAFPLSRFYKDLGKLPAKRVLAALDSCFSGAGGRSVLAKGARPLITQLDLSVPQGGKLVVFTASRADQISGTLEDKGHGAFTYYFLKGLGGEAAEGGAGRVTAGSLYAYLAKRVNAAAHRQEREQNPQLLPSVEASGSTPLR